MSINPCCEYTVIPWLSIFHPPPSLSFIPSFLSFSKGLICYRLSVHITEFFFSFQASKSPWETGVEACRWREHWPEQQHHHDQCRFVAARPCGQGAMESCKFYCLFEWKRYIIIATCSSRIIRNSAFRFVFVFSICFDSDCLSRFKGNYCTLDALFLKFA